MKLIPHHTVTLKAAASKAVVSAQLSQNVEPIKWIRVRLLARDHAPYQGVVSEDSFKIYRIIHYRNSFLPVIRGRFEERGDYTLIHLTMSLHPAVIAFLGVWTLMWCGFAIPIALAALSYSGNGIFLVFLLFPFLFLAIAWAAFWFEVNRSQRDLEQILGATCEAI